MVNQRSEMREEMKLVTGNLDDRWLKAAAGEVCQNLNKLLAEGVKVPFEYILAFQPLQPGSLDLSAFVSTQLQKGLRIYVPCGTTEDFTCFEIHSDLLKTQEFKNIPAVNCESISDAPFTLDGSSTTAVILPGLAFDSHGNRIGWGKLHYEHLFRKPFMKNAVRIGVCWELQFQNEVPAGNTDLLVDWVVHERGIIETGPKFSSDQDLVLEE